MFKKRGIAIVFIAVLMTGTVFGSVVYRNVEGDPGRDCQCMKFDSDNDCDIDVFDFDIFAQAWGSINYAGDYNPCCDNDDDGDVDVFDFDRFGRHWGESDLCPGCPNCTAPPWEPW